MRIRKVIDKTFLTEPGEDNSRINVQGGISAVIAATVGEGENSVNHVSSTQRVSVVQRSGKKSSAGENRSNGTEKKP